jgi:putative transposase
MQRLGRHYVRFFNHRYRRTGTLFEGRFKSSIVQNERYFLACQRYIELNPVRAGMVADPANYSWSSYRAHAFGKRPAMWEPHDEYLALGSDQQSRQTAYRQLFSQQLPGNVITDIRDALNTGLVLGNDCFREQVQLLTGVRQQHLKRGPRPRKRTNRQA